jgi:hypothetical protein
MPSTGLQPTDQVMIGEASVCQQHDITVMPQQPSRFP